MGSLSPHYFDENSRKRDDPDTYSLGGTDQTTVAKISVTVYIQEREFQRFVDPVISLTNRALWVRSIHENKYLFLLPFTYLII